MDERCGARSLRLTRHNARAERMHRIEALTPALGENADEVDHRVGAAHGGLYRVGITQVRLHGVDLSHASQRLEMADEIGIAARHTDAPAALGERAHDITSEKTAAAEHDREPTLRNLRL